jgi:hypothetical protein
MADAVMATIGVRRPDPSAVRIVPGRLVPVHGWHPAVHQDEVVRHLGVGPDRSIPSAATVRAVAQRLEHAYGDLLVGGVVVDHEHEAGRTASHRRVLVGSGARSTGAPARNDVR